MGERITIKYNPTNPDEYYVPTGAYATKTGNLLIGFGIFMVAFAGVAMVMKFVFKR